MKFSTVTPRAARGQLKCYDCRKSFPMKEGDWHHRGSQQVFLCQSCNKAQQGALYGKTQSSNES